MDGYDLRIYNRWGFLVFQTNVQGEGWSGRINNNIVQSDVYVYQISYDYTSELGGIELKQQIGTVTLLK